VTTRSADAARTRASAADAARPRAGADPAGPTVPRGQRFAGLHVLCDDDPRWPRSPLDQARAACAGGAQVLQLRAKHLPDRELIGLALGLRRLTRDSGALLVVNDRFDCALACEAAAVHLGQSDLPPAALPRDVRARLAVGRSTHTLEEARASNDEPVDYVAFGPVFGTRSKDTGFDARGLDALAAVVECVAPRPVIAIGGITVDDVARVRAAGARGVAVISAVAGAPDATAAAAAFVAGWRVAGDAEAPPAAERRRDG